jgi:bifunctional DNA-binding transcriptional regulator/antitoxin component of YhaV-PrlF toxin-antitoxin module
MITTIPKAVKLWGRGQLTIPKELRRALKLDEETVLNVFVVGRSLVLTPKRLVGPSLAKEFQRSMKEQGVTLEDLLRELKAQRRRYHREPYGL